MAALKELNRAEHIWPGSLSDRLEKQNLLEEIERLQGKENREFAKSVLEAGLEANKKIVKNLIGDGSMSEELLEILKPIAEPQRKKDIRIMIDTLRELGHQDSKIKMIIMEKYELSEENADLFLNEIQSAV